MPLPSERQLQALQLVINQAITLDPLATQRLEDLSGKRFRVECIDPEIDLIIAVDEQSVLLLTPDSDPVDTHISGDLSSYTKLLSSDDKAAAIINSGLQVKGDSANLLLLQEILANTELDWEYHLANVIGDLPAHLFGRASREALSWLKDTRPIFERHLKEFILEEAKLSPTQNEIDLFIDNNQKLRERTERVEAKLSRLQQQLEGPVE
jgi:ubiquinone biosynthesis protein UbiJ